MSAAGLVVRPIEPGDYAEVSRLTVEAYRADGQLENSPEYARILADVAGRAAAADVLVAVDALPGADAPDAGGPATSNGAESAARPARTDQHDVNAARSVASPTRPERVTGGAVLGAVTFTLPGGPYAEVCREGEAEFRTLAVDPAAQRRGVARALVQACIDRAMTLNCEALAICVRAGNAAAFALYGGFGFERDPSRDWSPVPGVELLGMRLPLVARRTAVQELPVHLRERVAQ